MTIRTRRRFLREVTCGGAAALMASRSRSVAASLAAQTADISPWKSRIGLERQLEGHQVMGIKYTEIRAASPAPGPSTPDPRRPATLPPGAYFDAGTGRVRNAFKETEAFGPYQPPVSLESVKRRAAQFNADGKVATKFGMKVLVHNHTGEFEKLADSPRTTFDILLEDTDPALVTFQLDLGHRAGGRRPHRLQAGIRSRHARGLEAFRDRAGQRRRLGRLARRRARVVSEPGGRTRVAVRSESRNERAPAW
jgi:hypothetical protein